MKLARWVEQVRAMSSPDLEKLRTEYDAYQRALVTQIQTKLGPMSRTTKQLSACNGVLSSAQAALDAMRDAEKDVTVARFESDNPNHAVASPIAVHLQRWEKLGELPDYPKGPTPSINL